MSYIFITLKRHNILLIVILGLLLHSLSISAINMKVGDIEHISLGNIPRLQGCIWTISRPNDVVFTTTPSNYSTDVFIKAINAFPTSSPCIVQCKYYYLEQDPTTGKYTYSRTGYKDWEIYVTKSGSNEGSNEGTQNASLSLSFKVASVNVDEWLTIDAITSSSSNLSWSLSNPCAYFVKKSNTRIRVRGVCGGTTVVTCKDNKGNIATCKVTINPKNSNSYSVGDYIYAEAEGLYGKKYLIPYLITNTEDPQCILKKAGGYIIPDNKSFKGELIVPFDVQGFKVTSIEEGAFRDCKNLKSIKIPGNVKIIGPSVFSGCEQLSNVEIEEGVENIGRYCFANCQLQNITIPSTVTNIGNWCFYENQTIHVKCYINPPFDVGEILPIVTSNQILYVPYGTKELYKNAQGWNKFQNIIEMEASTGINGITISNKVGKGIYTINGLLLEGKTKEELPKGIYIIDGKKYIK